MAQREFSSGEQGAQAPPDNWKRRAAREWLLFLTCLLGCCVAVLAGSVAALSVSGTLQLEEWLNIVLVDSRYGIAAGLGVYLLLQVVRLTVWAVRTTHQR